MYSTILECNLNPCTIGTKNVIPFYPLITLTNELSKQMIRKLQMRCPYSCMRNRYTNRLCFLRRPSIGAAAWSAFCCYSRKNLRCTMLHRCLSCRNIICTILNIYKCIFNWHQMTQINRSIITLYPIIFRKYFL